MTWNRPGTLNAISRELEQELAETLAEARTTAKRALVLSREHKQRSAEAWSLYLLGEIASRVTPLDLKHAEDSYRQALTLAEELGMGPLQAACSHGLGMFSSQTNQVEHARSALSTAIAMYGAMPMTFWLPHAEAALAQGGD